MASWCKLIAEGEVSEGCPRGIEVNGIKIGLFRFEGQIYAIDDVCTHAFALLSNGFQEGPLVECPLHAGFFDIRNGKGQGAPIERDVTHYPVRVEDGWVYAQLP